MNESLLPEIGMLIGSPIYLDRGDYVFQHTGGFYTSWVSEDHDPEWYLDKVIEDNQGNLVVFWDGGVTKRCLRAKAAWLDLEGIGHHPPEPNWKEKKFLLPEDWSVIAAHPEREGAGLYALAKKAAELGLHSYSIYADAAPEWIEKTHALNGWFVGANIGEFFSFQLDRSDASESDFNHRGSARHKVRDADLEIVANHFRRSVESYFKGKRKSGWRQFLITSASFHLDSEIAAAGGDDVIPHVECFAFHNLNFGMALCRGVHRQFNTPLWGAYLAHEHYSYVHYSCERKFEMLDAAFLLSYMNGSKITVLESGNWWQQTDHAPDTAMHDTPKIDVGSINRNDPRDYAHLVPEARKHYPKLNYHSEICGKYRRSLSNFYDFVKANGTPKGQPSATLAAIKGRYDFCSQEFNPNLPVASAGDVAERNPFWYEGAPEKGWEIFRKVFNPLHNTIEPYHNTFFSGTPHGLIDLVSFADEPTADYLSRRYRALVFTGWNTASEKQYKILLDYVRNGGVLFAGIPHFAKIKDRNHVAYQVDDLVHDGDLSELCGVRILSRGRTFYWALALEDNPFGSRRNRRFGPCCVHMGNLEITGKPKVLAAHDETFKPILLMNECGEGKVFFLNVWEYPGSLDVDRAPGAPADSKGLIGEIYHHIAMLTRGEIHITDDGVSPGVNCEHICYSHFPEDGTLCLLNVDFANDREFHLHRGGESDRVRLKPLEFKTLKT